MAKNQFEKLLEPGKIGSLTTKNRIVKPGAAARYWGVGDNMVNAAIKNYYEAFARGGVGLLIVEGPTVDVDEMRMNGNYRMDDDKYIKPVSELTSLIHKHNCPALVQLNYNCNWQKMMVWSKEGSPNPPVGPSPVCVKSIMDNNNEMVREITIEEIQTAIDKIATITVRLNKAGFDGLELNAASTHLFHAFLSPFWNKRTDRYGSGSLENRARFLTETIHEIKKRLGKDFPITMIINGLEMGTLIGVENSECLTAEDARGVSILAEKAGVDAVEVRSQWLGRHDASFLTEHFYYPEPPVSPKDFPAIYPSDRRGHGVNMLISAAMKKVLHIPVMVVGRLDPVLGEKILEDGQADFICLNRRLIADPELPNKLAAGRPEDIAPCTACTTCKVMGAHRRCRINANIGSDKSYLIEPATKQKKVMVIGGGPAGMEAARVAALRGHKVTLFEKASKLGGLLPMAAMVKGLEIEELPEIIRYLKGQMIKNGVDIRMGKTVDAAMIETIKPDVLILATGGKDCVPQIKGINRPNVVSNEKLHKQLSFFLKFAGPGTLNWLTKFWMPLGKRVVIIGSDIHGCELAEFLTKRGRQVTMVDTAKTPGEGMINHLRLQLFDWFAKKGVVMINGVKEYMEINEKGLVVLMAEGYKRTIEADSVVPVAPLQPDSALLKSFEGKAAEVYAIGDCANPKLIVDAIGDGNRVGRMI